MKKRDFWCLLCAKKNEKEAAFPVTDTLLDTHEKKMSREKDRIVGKVL